MVRKKRDLRPHSLIRSEILSCRRSQVTIFIILAIVIVAVLLIIFYPRIKVLITPLTPTQYVDDCVKKEISPILEKISNQGGSINPQNSLQYADKEIEYLCYTNEYYKTCTMQQPLLKQHVEQEITNAIKDKAEACVDEMKSNYESRGYRVSLKNGGVSVEIVPHAIKVIIEGPMVVQKESTQSFDKFIITQQSEIYDSLLIAQSILNYEARYGDSAPETFMLMFPDLRITKLKQSDGSKIYNITNTESREQFIFASRSLSWPAGFGFEEKYIRT